MRLLHSFLHRTLTGKRAFLALCIQAQIGRFGVSPVGISFHCQQWDLSELQLLHLYDGSSTGPTSERCHEAWGG